MGAALPEFGLDTLDRLLSMALANPSVTATAVVGVVAVVAGLYVLR